MRESKKGKAKFLSVYVLRAKPSDICLCRVFKNFVGLGSGIASLHGSVVLCYDNKFGVSTYGPTLVYAK